MGSIRNSAILSRSGDISTPGLYGRHLEFPTSAYFSSTTPAPLLNLHPQPCPICCTHCPRVHSPIGADERYANSIQFTPPPSQVSLPLVPPLLPGEAAPVLPGYAPPLAPLPSAAILDFQLPVSLVSICNIVVEFLYPENMRVAIGSDWLFCLEAEI